MHRSRRERLQKERAKARTNQKMTPRLLSQRVWPSILRFSSLRIRISSQRFRYIHPNGIGQQAFPAARFPRSYVTRFAALTTLTPSNISTTGNIRHLTPKGQNPTHAGILDVSSIPRTSPNCRGRNGGVPEHFNPFFQYVFAFGAGTFEHKQRVRTHPLDSKDGSSDRW